MARLFELIDLVARSTIPVLVIGETGVGKEVVSTAIHERSPRASGPLVRLNCAAMPEALLESELFGYERGAFTGAVQSKPGLVEAAHEGTLFLDEIGEIPLSTQAKLLRVLESGELLRLGALKPRSVDVRFVAATNRDLRGLVAEGRFRGDLYYRLDGITIPVPPLRARPADVPRMAEHFLAAAAGRAGRAAPRLSPDVVEVLTKYAWPGNVRELRNVMERAVALCGGGALTVAHVVLQAGLPIAGLPGTREPPDWVPAAGAPPPRDAASGGRLLRLDPQRERAIIVEALERAGGNQSKACELLGISRRTLLHRLDEHGLPRPRKRT
jgi:transcriptional regulator with PAS, ATPase and Fis domain